MSSTKMDFYTKLYLTTAVSLFSVGLYAFIDIAGGIFEFHSNSVEIVKKHAELAMGAQGLMKKSDCFTCHQVEGKLIGPSFQEIAYKYENTPSIVEQLAGKIKQGGSGNWEDVPMTPHPNLSAQKIHSMVKWIFAQKTSSKLQH